MRCYWLSIVVLLFMASCGQKEDRVPKITPKIDSLLAKANDFSGVVLVAGSGKIVYHKAFGYSNFETRQPPDTNGVFEIGSISDEFIAAARKIQQKENASGIDLTAIVRTRIFVPLKMTSTDFRSHTDKRMLRNMAWSNVIDTTKTTVSSTTSDLLKWVNHTGITEAKGDYPGYRSMIVHDTVTNKTIIILSNNAYPGVERLVEEIEKLAANL